MNKPLRAICFTGLLLGGCASTGVHPIGAGQYFISEQSAQLLFGTPVLAERSAYKAAQEFCDDQGKHQVNTLKLDTKSSLLQTPGYINLTFSCDANPESL